MKPQAVNPAAIAQQSLHGLALSGSWTVFGMGAIEQRLEAAGALTGLPTLVDATRIEVLDTAGAWVLNKLLLRLRAQGGVVTLNGLRPELARLLELVSQQVAGTAHDPARAAQPAATPVEVALALRSLLKVRQWAARAVHAPRWTVLMGLVSPLLPAVLLLAMPQLLTGVTGHYFGYVMLARAMPEVIIFLAVCGGLGTLAGAARWVILVRHSQHAVSRETVRSTASPST